MEVQQASDVSHVEWSKGDTEGVVHELVILVQIIEAGTDDFVGLHQLQLLFDALQHLVIADLMGLALVEPAEVQAVVAEYCPGIASVTVLSFGALITPAVVVFPAVDHEDVDAPALLDPFTN